MSPQGDLTVPNFQVSARPTPERAEGTSGPVLTFARDQYYWSPLRLFRTVWGVSTNLTRQIEILRLMRFPAYADFLRIDPRFRFRFLIRDYLVRGFSTGQRAACFLHHYKRLRATMSADLLLRTLHRKVTLFEAKRDCIDCEISLSFSRPFEKEGELSLSLHVDGAIVFVLSFTIIPGSIVKSEVDEVMLISRLQGTNGFYPEIRAATRALEDVGPAALLLAALHGFAEAFGIRAMAAVSAVRQTSFEEEAAVVYKSAYDDFFSEVGFIRNTSGFFLSSVPAEDRPISFIKKGHKIRTKKKRRFKQQIAEDVCLLLRPQLCLADSPLSHQVNTVQTVSIGDS